MPEAPRGPDTSRDTPEARRMIESIWGKLIESDTGAITAETRRWLQEVLSQEKLDSLLEKGRHSGPKKTPIMKRSGMDSILQELVSKRVGMFPVIEKRMEKKMKDQGVASIDQFELQTAALPQILENLVRDPDTPEAKALACLYSDLVTPTTYAYFTDIFDSVDESEARNAETLKMLQNLYKEITGNKNYLGIGKDPGTGPGSGKLKKLQDEITRYEAAILAASATTTTPTGHVSQGNPAPYIDAKNKAETKMEALTSAKSDLEGKLSQFNTLLQALNAKNLGGAGVKITAPGIRILASDFSIAKFDAVLGAKSPHVDNSYVEIGGKTQTVRKWFIDKELPAKADQAITQFRQAGNGLIPSSMAYQRLLRRAVGSSVGILPEEAEPLIQQVGDRMLSSNAPPDSAAKEPGFWSKVGKAFSRKKEQTGKAASHATGFLGKVWSYLNEKV